MSRSKTTSKTSSKTAPKTGSKVATTAKMPPATYTSVTHAQGDFASLGSRVVAYLVDSFLLALPLPLGLWYITTQAGLVDMTLTLVQVFLAVWLPWILVCVSYEVVGISRWGQTLGKFLVGIKVTDEAGRLLSWKRTFFRHQVAKMVSFSPLGLGLWAMVFDKDKRTWHDHLAGTVVHVVEEARVAVGLAVLAALVVAHVVIYYQAAQSFMADQALMELIRSLVSSFSV